MTNVDNFVSYPVWDRSVRWFHWINVLAFLWLLGTGLAIYNGSALGLSGSGKVLLKTVHVLGGYVMVVNLVWRLVWGFIGGEFARWRAILPFQPGYLAELRAWLQAQRTGAHRYYLGHNPPGRLMVSALLLLLVTQAITGLVLAGTDIYYPPLGSWIAEWVAAPGVDPASLIPGDKSMADAAAWNEMRAFRKPYISVHEFAFFVLCGAVVLHIIGVVMGEVRERVGLVSAMFNGRKVLPKPPVDTPKK